MRFKSRFKSCLWTKTDLWGNLVKKRSVLLKIKWDRLISILQGKKRRRYQKLCKNYNYTTPYTRPNQPYKFPRWDFRNSLSNKLCIRRFYGDLSVKYLKRICRVKNSKYLIKSLENRLDINLYRLGFFNSIFESRQAILHNKVLVNGKRINFDHFLLKPGDLIEFCPFYRKILRADILARRNNINYLDRFKLKPTPSWIHTDYCSLSFIVHGKTNLSLFYPFRVRLDDVVSAINYDY